MWRVSSPEAARSAMRGLAWGAITVRRAAAARRDSIFDSARWPAPITVQGRAVSLRKMGKSDISKHRGFWSRKADSSASLRNDNYFSFGEGQSMAPIGIEEIGRAH